MHGHQSERPFELPADLPHRLRRITARRIRLREQMGDDLGVGLGRQIVAALGKFGAQRGKVLDDAVVHDGDAPRIVEMRVGIGIGGSAVGGPTGVPDPCGPGRKGLLHQRLLQIDELPGLLHGGKPAVRENGDARGVVTPVFEALEPRDDNIKRGLPTDVTDDSTHNDPFVVALPSLGIVAEGTRGGRDHSSAASGVALT